MKTLIISSCCGFKTSYIPPCFGEEGMYICMKCHTETDPNFIRFEPYTLIGVGIKRKKTDELVEMGFDPKVF